MEAAIDNSLTLQNVEAALMHLTSGIHVKEAEGILLDWEETQAITYTQLLLCATLAPRVRLAALLSLKAVVLRKWKDRGRRNPVTFLDDSTKIQIRNMLLSMVTTGENPLVNEPSIPAEYRSQYEISGVLEDRTVQATIASCLVQVARFDLPRTFHELIPTLVSCATQATAVGQANSLYALEAILDELKMKRLLVDKQYMVSVSKAHLSVLVEGCFVPALQSAMGSCNPNASLSEHTVLAIKTVHHILQSSLTSLLEAGGGFTNVVDRVFAITLECCSALVGGGRDSNVAGQTTVMQELLEMVVDVQQAHPIAFSRFLEHFLGTFYTALVTTTTAAGGADIRSLLQHYATTTPQPSHLPDDVLILLLRFFANIVSCSYYMPDESANEAVAVVQSETAISSKGDANVDILNIRQAVDIVWNQFFTFDHLCRLSDRCVCNLMLLTPDRLEIWNDSPEEFFLADSQRSAEEDVAAAAQNLYCALIESKPGQSVVLLRLVAFLGEVNAQQLACGIEGVGVLPGGAAVSGFAHPSALLWDSIYTAAGLAATVLEENGDWRFNNFFLGVLVPSLKQARSASSVLPLLRRRIIWLIGCNSQNIDWESHPFQVLVDIIAEGSSPQNDIAVRLSCVESMSSLLYNFEVSARDCVPLAEVTINSLYQLATQCEELASQSRILECVSLVLSCIMSTGSDIRIEVANAAVAPISSLWAAKPMLRTDTLSIVSLVASAVGKRQAGTLQPVALFMIRNALDPECSNEDPSLVPNALSLWLTISRLANGYNCELGRDFAVMKRVLENDLENLKVAMMVTENLILTGGRLFLGDNEGSLLEVLQLTVGKVRPRGALYVATVLEALLRGFPVEGSMLLTKGGILQTMLHSCAANYLSCKDYEPDRVIVLYLSAISRMLLTDSAGLLDAVLPIQVGSSGSDVFGAQQLVHLFFRLFDYSGSFDTNTYLRQKLWLLCLLSLLPPHAQMTTSMPAAVLQSFGNLMTVSLDFVSRNVRDEEIQPFTVCYDSEEETIIVPGTSEYEALLRHEMTKDVVYTTDLVDLFKTKVTGLRQAVGNEIHQQLLNSVEPNTKLLLVTFLNK